MWWSAQLDLAADMFVPLIDVGKCSTIFVFRLVSSPESKSAFTQIGKTQPKATNKYGKKKLEYGDKFSNLSIDGVAVIRPRFDSDRFCCSIFVDGVRLLTADQLSCCFFSVKLVKNINRSSKCVPIRRNSVYFLKQKAISIAFACNSYIFYIFDSELHVRCCCILLVPCCKS